MSERKQIIPQYGPFAGMRVIDSGSLIAMPYAATLLADFGAEVIHIERPGVGDTLRVLAPFAKEDGKTVSTSWAQDGRNKLSLSLELNLKHPEVKELFFGLIKEADVFMENMVWLEKLGIRDEELLEVNPKLIIAHISGYGNPRFGGLPEYCDRASYDMIGQAFSGWMGLNGEKGGDPVVGKPWLNDFTSAYAAVFAVLAAYINVLKGGDGQIVDIAQFEVQASYCCDLYTSYTMAGRENTRSGNKSAAFQPYGLFKSKDGYDVALGAFGPGVYKRAIQAMNLDLEYFNYKDCSSGIEAVASEKGRELDAKTIEWCAARTAQEIEEPFWSGVPELQPVPAVHGLTERDAGRRTAGKGTSGISGKQKGHPRGAGTAGERTAGADGPFGAGRPLPASALRRPAAACGHCPRAGASPGYPLL